MPNAAGVHRVVVVGAGFGGLAVARGLAGGPVAVTLVDRHNFHTFSPLLYQVATAGLAPDDIAPNLRGIVRDARNVEPCLATVVRVDLDRREVHLDHGDPVPYDTLVLALGAVSRDFGIPGVAANATALKTLADATRVRNLVLRRFEEASADPGVIDDGALTFVVAGGGPTGVELCGALGELFTEVLRKDFGRIEVTRARVVLVEMGDALLPSFSPQSQAEARRGLEARGVEVLLGTAITRVDADCVQLADGRTIATRTVVWAAGVAAHPLGAAMGLPVGRAGAVVVGPDLSVEGRPEVFVVGDLASVADADGQALPQLAPVAMQQGRFVARAILRRRRGRRAGRFHYRDKGTMATIGRRSAVAELPLGIRFDGTLGWLSWLGLHLVFLVGFRNRAVVLLNWAWNYVRWDRGNRALMEG